LRETEETEVTGRAFNTEPRRSRRRTEKMQVISDRGAAGRSAGVEAVH
jgi:hypothetical protein